MSTKIYNPWVEKLSPRTAAFDPAVLLPLWPLCELEGSRRQAEKDLLAAIKQERVKCGAYNADYQAYEILFAKGNGSGRINWKTRGHCPAAYRPILRLLNCRIAWSLIAFEVKIPADLLGNDKGKGRGKGKGKKAVIRTPSPMSDTLEEELRQLDDPINPALVKERYALWRDGHLRNIFYHTLVRRKFFTWLEKSYYNGKSAAGKRPVTVPMAPLRCDILEAWLKIELFIGCHNHDSIVAFKVEKAKMKMWNNLVDIFACGTSIYLHYLIIVATIDPISDWNKLGSKLVYYGTPLNADDPNQAEVIQAQIAAGNAPHPIDEDFTVMRQELLDPMEGFLHIILSHADISTVSFSVFQHLIQC